VNHVEALLDAPRVFAKAIKAIARDLHVSRKVIRKAIRAPEGAFDYRRKVQPLPRIGPFQDRLDVLLEENELRGRRDRLRMTRIHDLLVREGFEGSYDAVRRYAARWKIERRRDVGDGTTAFIRCCSSPARPTSSTGATRMSRSPASRCG
jgi:transposase